MTILGHCFDNPRTVRIHYPIRSRPYTKEMNNKKQTREKEQKKKIRKTHTHTPHNADATERIVADKTNCVCVTT